MPAGEFFVGQLVLGFQTTFAHMRQIQLLAAHGIAGQAVQQGQNAGPDGI